ncbi:MAG: hypothetical protein U5J97_04060 [Trueperaceae bacterium]|nr:hypothetical protein [Trueperaceae bacterium]
MSQRRFRAGCRRERIGPSDLDEIAYLELAFPECPTCPHRVEPEGGPSFCRWIATDRPTAFEVLARFDLGEGDAT